MRTLKVSTLYRPARTRGAAQQVPHLRLTGQWLERAGFTAGGRVIVELLGGIITLKPFIELSQPSKGAVDV